MTMIVAATGTAEGSARLAAAGADRIVAYHSSAYRGAGLPSVAGLLPWASANEQTLEMLPGVLHSADGAPVLATVCANDGLRTADEMLERLDEAGVAGVLNAPTVGLLEGTIRAVLEAEGLGRSSEMALLAAAREHSLESWAYVFGPEWVRESVRMGATGVIIHLGITGYPSPVDLARCLEAAVESGAEEVLLHGGALGSPEDLRTTIANLPDELAGAITGYMGASVFERSDDVAASVNAWRNVLRAVND